MTHEVLQAIIIYISLKISKIFEQDDDDGKRQEHDDQFDPFILGKPGILEKEDPPVKGQKDHYEKNISH